MSSVTNNHLHHFDTLIQIMKGLYITFEIIEEMWNLAKSCHQLVTHCSNQLKNRQILIVSLSKKILESVNEEKNFRKLCKLGTLKSLKNSENWFSILVLPYV